MLHVWGLCASVSYPGMSNNHQQYKPDQSAHTNSPSPVARLPQVQSGCPNQLHKSSQVAHTNCASPVPRLPSPTGQAQPSCSHQETSPVARLLTPISQAQWPGCSHQHKPGPAAHRPHFHLPQALSIRLCAVFYSLQQFHRQQLRHSATQGKGGTSMIKDAVLPLSPTLQGR